MDGNLLLSTIPITELVSLITKEIIGGINKPTLPQQQFTKTELPIGFKKALVVLDMKERTLRAKCASNEIPHYQRARQLYFFESELIEYIKTGKKKTNSELQQEAADYIKKSTRK
jgi:hypothetical protein